MKQHVGLYKAFILFMSQRYNLNNYVNMIYLSLWTPAILPGEGFKLFISEVFIGGHTAPDKLNIPSNVKPYIGYLRNFYINDFDVFRFMQGGGFGTFYQYPNIPLLVFNDITLPTYNSFITLDGLVSLDKLNMHFLFKTTEANGVLFFNEGTNRDMFAVELFDGRLHVKVRAF